MCIYLASNLISFYVLITPFWTVVFVLSYTQASNILSFVRFDYYQFQNFHTPTSSNDNLRVFNLSRFLNTSENENTDTRVNEGDMH